MIHSQPLFSRYFEFVTPIKLNVYNCANDVHTIVPLLLPWTRLQAVLSSNSCFLQNQASRRILNFLIQDIVGWYLYPGFYGAVWAVTVSLLHCIF